MNLSKLTNITRASLAEKSRTKARNQANLCRIASTLQQADNAQTLHNLENFLK